MTGWGFCCARPLQRLGGTSGETRPAVRPEPHVAPPAVPTSQASEPRTRSLSWVFLDTAFIVHLLCASMELG